MTIDVIAAGRTRTVELRRENGKFLVSLDGQQHEVSVSEGNGVVSLLVGPAEAGLHVQEAGPHVHTVVDRNNSNVGVDFSRPTNSNVGAGFSRPARSYEVTVGAGVVHVDGVAVEVELARPTWARRGEHVAHDHTGPQRVPAPMPGKIVKVLVKPGDHVEPRQGLVVVEAMKMENELRSRAAGTVTEVRAVEGSSVEAGAILIVVE